MSEWCGATAKTLKATLFPAAQGEWFQKPRWSLFLSVLHSAKEALLKGERLSEAIQTQELLTVRDSILRLALISLPNILYSVYHKHGLNVGLKFLRQKKENRRTSVSAVIAVSAAQCWFKPQSNLSSENQKRGLFSRQIKKQSVKLRLQNWLLLPLCILAFLYNGNLWHLQVRRATQQRSHLSLFLQNWTCQSRDKISEKGHLCRNITARLRHIQVKIKGRIRNKMQFKCLGINAGLRGSKWMPRLPLLYCLVWGEPLLVGT